MSFVLNHYKSRMDVVHYFGSIVEAAILPWAATTEQWARVLNNVYNLERSMKPDRASEMVTSAINGEPFPEDDYRKAMTLQGTASMPALTVGDAKMKASYWMAVASRVVSSRSLADEARRLLSSISRDDYDDQSTNRIGSVGGSAVEKVLRDAVLKPPSLDAGMVDPKVKGIPEIITTITDASRIENARRQVLDPQQEREAFEERARDLPGEMMPRLPRPEKPDWFGPAVAAVAASALLVGLAINQRRTR